MEVLLPTLTGCLTACCIWLLLTDGGGARREGLPADSQSWRARVGSRLLESRVVSRSHAELLQDELSRWKCAGKHLVVASPEVALGTLVAASVLAAPVAMALAGTPLAAPVGLLLPTAVAEGRIAARKKHAARELEEAMPEAFSALAISLGSGHSLPQAMRFVGGHADEPIRTEFTRVSFAIDCGVPAARALDAMLKRLRAPGLELVVLSLKVSKRTGAPLRELLGEASKLAGDRIELRRRLDVKTSQARMSARVVAFMPIAMIVLLSLLSSDFRRGVMTLTGAACVVIALVLNALAWSIIRKIMRVDL